MRDIDAELGISHRDGVWWHDAPIPRRWHRCTPWTRSLLADRCACGAIRTPFGWTDKNSRRRKRRK
jgi:hypothetical protein